LIAVGIKTAIIKKDLSLIMGMPLAIICMHISWGLGFLYSIIKK